MQISQLNGNDLVMRGGLLLDAIFPVGSVYVSSNNQSPAQFLGGTWERVENVFPLFAGRNMRPEYGRAGVGRVDGCRNAIPFS